MRFVEYPPVIGAGKISLKVKVRDKDRLKLVRLLKNETPKSVVKATLYR